MLLLVLRDGGHDRCLGRELLSRAGGRMRGLVQLRLRRVMMLSAMIETTGW